MHQQLPGNANNIEIRLKNCKLNLSGYTTSLGNSGIVSNSWATNQKIYFDNCKFLTQNSKKFASWASSTPNAYIKSNCTPSGLNEFSKYTYTGRAEWTLHSIPE